MLSPGFKEFLLYSILLGTLLSGLYLSHFSSSFFEEVFTAEDGVIEYSTAILLFCSSILLFVRFLKLKAEKKIWWKVGILFIAILFFFAAGEEISWGQRLLNFSSGEFFNKKNLQKETNLHNLTVGEVNLNKLIFGKLITIFLLLYLLVLPFLYKKNEWVKTLINNFAIPIVKWHHVAAFIGGTFFVLMMDSGRKWEVYEFCFALLFLMIFLNPHNRKIYQSGTI